MIVGDHNTNARRSDVNFAWLIGPLPEPKSQQPATPPKQEPDGDVMVQDLETPQKVEQPQAEKKGNKSTKKKQPPPVPKATHVIDHWECTFSMNSVDYLYKIPYLRDLSM